MLRCMGCMAEMPEEAQYCPLCGYAAGTPAREAYHLPPGTILQGKYIAGRVLGYGGFGVTYIGYDAALERVVAIKEFLPSTFATRMPGHTAVTVYDGNATQQFDAGLTRFVEEGQTLAQFNGIPGIVDIYDSFLGNNTAYIVMQFLKGQDVKEKLNTNGPLPYEEARDIVLKICDTLAPVHARGIIHRDISPDNIYLTEAGEVKLLDFGAARYESAMNSKSLSVILKSGYAPEEQYRSRGEQGPWTDVYALAASFYKMLTGQTPPDSMERAIQDEIKEPSKLGAELPESAENAILNALCVRKADRTKTVTDFKNALLSDGVERVKVKHRGAGTTRVPVGARVAIAASVGLLVLLGLFTAAGGFGGGGIIGGTKLEDNYGSASRSGFVSVPSLAGLSRSEAEKALTDLGLSAEVGGYGISLAELTEPRVTGQEPVAGKQVEAGSGVKITLDVGELRAAAEKGWVPQVVGQPVGQAAAFFENTRMDNLSYDFRFVYSPPESNGVVTSITMDQYDDGYEYYRVEVGVGPDDAAPLLGALRFAYLQHDSLRYVIASPGYDNTGENTEQNRQVNHIFRLAPAGTNNWQELKKEGWYNGYSTSEESTPYDSGTNLLDQIVLTFPELEGQALQLEMLRSYQDNDEILDSYLLPQTFQFTFNDTQPLQVDTAELLSFEEAKALYDEGAFDKNDSRVQDYFTDEQMQEDYVCLRLVGSFPQNGYSYRIYWENNDQWVRPSENGDILSIMSKHQFMYIEEGTEAFLTAQVGNLEVDLNGNIKAETLRPAGFTLPYIPNPN